MEKEKNIILMVILNIMENIIMERNEMDLDMILIIT